MRISAELVFPNQYAADCADDDLRDLGYVIKARDDRIDDYSPAVFMQAIREVDVDADNWWTAADAMLDDLNKVVDPFGGLADDAGPADESDVAH
jgi:hypothetical protein